MPGLISRLVVTGISALGSIMLLLILVLGILLCSTECFVLNNNNIFRQNVRPYLFGKTNDGKSTVNVGGGGMGGMGNIMEAMMKAQDVARRAEELNKELSTVFIKGNDPTGQVEAVYSALGVPVSVTISDSLLELGSEAVSLAVSKAIIDAHSKAQKEMLTKMSALYEKSGLPSFAKPQ